MTIILFLLDNSISMGQKTNSGCSFLDIAKKSVEMFLKFRSRDFNHRMDRIMLMTFDEPPTHLKVGWRESLLVFQNELKNMQATAMSDGSQILSSAFEMLNVNRLQSGIDTYGQGRNPFYVESCVIVLLTDGHSFTMESQSELIVTMNSKIPGLELTREPYRWDQRLFSVVLKIPGVRMEEPNPAEAPPDMVPRDTSALEGFSSLTGGRSFCIESVRWVDNVMMKLADLVAQNGVMVRLEPSEEAAFHASAVNRMIFLPRNPQKSHANGHWPLPEPFWADLRTQSVIPSRDSHPVLKFQPSMEEIPVAPSLGDVPLPVDKYEVEQSALTSEFLEKAERYKHWPVYVNATTGPDRPPIPQLCGYLAMQNRTETGQGPGPGPGPGNEKVLALHVLPVNYPILFDLLERFNKTQNRKEWKAQFDSYIQGIPPYMASAIRRFLLKANLHTMIPDSYDQCLSTDLQNYLRKVKVQAKAVFEGTTAYPNQPLPIPDLIPVIQRFQSAVPTLETPSPDANAPQKDNYDDLLAKSVQEQMANDANTFRMHLRLPIIMQQRIHIPLHHNPFDVDREDLVSQLASLKFSLLHPHRWKGSTEADKSIPIAQMGNYQEYLKGALQPLRDLAEDAPKQVNNTFGNPWISPKKMRQRSASAGAGGMGGMVDEADVDNLGASNGPPRLKRTLSEVREGSSSTPNALKNKLRAGLRSPVKRQRHQSEPPLSSALLTNGLTPSISIAESAALPEPLDVPMPSSSKIVPVTAEDISPEEPPGTFAELVLDEPDDRPERPERPPPPLLTNGHPEGHTNGEMTDEETPHNSPRGNETHSQESVLKMKLLALKEIRSPGRNFKKILEMVNCINGNVTLKKTVIDSIITEARRYRRDSLIVVLQKNFPAFTSS
ncbi:hypothetical protein RvY_18299 [Ramazzottius varieornatus]|uniref:VWFA domain-containing protein n=1 Tax=Ramazzottius varieornatus TaxID=947166 RepID=A0A1D1W576_RAMVA|nr:hypothetical protein RvY_18299 [Ramazzottius varieornatus]